VNIIDAFDIFQDKKKALALCLARFDSDTKETFLKLYEKVDADANFDDSATEVEDASEQGNKCPF
jgi:hypothetical protein